METEPSQIELDEDRINLVTLLTMLVVVIAGLGTLAGTLYGILPPAAEQTTA